MISLFRNKLHYSVLKIPNKKSGPYYIWRIYNKNKKLLAQSFIGRHKTYESADAEARLILNL